MARLMRSRQDAAVYRFAIYAAADPDSLLHRLASAWLGRDAARGVDVPRPRLDGIGESAAVSWTAESARYGFHATLKPPFRLADTQSAEALHEAIGRFAVTRAAVSLGQLAVAELSGFLALRPVTEPPALRALADDVVQHFDVFRRPPDAAELDRRRAAKLTARQEIYLARWGYPWVMDDFRLHFTLTGRLDPAVRPRVRQILAEYLAPALAEPVTIDALWLFAEPSPKAPFLQMSRYPLAATGS
jgi:putative phosphonate metabolism protein